MGDNLQKVCAWVVWIRVLWQVSNVFGVGVWQWRSYTGCSRSCCTGGASSRAVFPLQGDRVLFNVGGKEVFWNNLFAVPMPQVSCKQGSGDCPRIKATENVCSRLLGDSDEYI